MATLSAEDYNALPERVQQYLAAAQARIDVLREQMEALTPFGNAVAAVQGPKAPKLPMPRTYSGSRNNRALRDWLYDVQQHFVNEPLKFVHGQTKIRFAASYLKGTARQWFQTIDESGSAPWGTDFEKFVKEIQRHFAELDPLAYWLKRWDNVKQKGSVNAYLTEFSAIAANLSLTEQVKEHHFKKGLSPEVLDHLALMPKPKDFNDLVAVANQIDGRLFERKRANGNHHERQQRNNGHAVREAEDQLDYGSADEDEDGDSDMDANTFGVIEDDDANDVEHHEAENEAKIDAEVDSGLNGDEDVAMQLDTFKHRSKAPKKGVKCFTCKQRGHYARDCPEQSLDDNNYDSNEED